MFLRRCEVIVPAVPVLHLLGGVLEAGQAVLILRVSVRQRASASRQTPAPVPGVG